MALWPDFFDTIDRPYVLTFFFLKLVIHTFSNGKVFDQSRSIVVTVTDDRM